VSGLRRQVSCAGQVVGTDQIPRLARTSMERLDRLTTADTVSDMQVMRGNHLTISKRRPRLSP